MIDSTRHHIERIVYGAFDRSSTSTVHGIDRSRFRGLGIDTTVEEYALGVRVLAWLVFAIAASLVYVGAAGETETVARVLHARVQVTEVIPVSWVVSGIHVLTSVGGGLIGRQLTFLTSRLALGLLARRRRIGIERTLPGAVRYLHVVAAGTTDPERLFTVVASKPAIHGETAKSFERILAASALSGSTEEGIRTVARETPSREHLAPFLLTFLARKREGSEGLRTFLARESRLLAIRDEQAHHREDRYRTVVLGLLVFVLVVPLLLVIGAIGLAIAIPELGPGSVTVPAGTSVADGIIRIGTVLVLVLGVIAAALAYHLRPVDLRWAMAKPAVRPIDVIRTAGRNPANTVIVLLPVGLGVAFWSLKNGYSILNSLLLPYVLIGLPTGVVDAVRARRRQAMDRRLPGFVHEVATRLNRGYPFTSAVERVATSHDFGPLQSAISSLVFDLEVGIDEDPVRKRALERFVGRIGTPFAGRTIGLGVGALEAGSDTQSAFEALQVETGRLAHAARARRSRLPVVVAVSWTVALLIVSIVVVLNVLVIETVEPIGSVPIQGVTLQPTLGRSTARPDVYVLAQSAMLSSGWFAGLAGRGIFEALLHSGALVTVTYLVFRTTGLV